MNRFWWAVLSLTLSVLLISNVCSYAEEWYESTESSSSRPAIAAYNVSDMGRWSSVGDVRMTSQQNHGVWEFEEQISDELRRDVATIGSVPTPAGKEIEVAIIREPALSHPSPSAGLGS